MDGPQTRAVLESGIVPESDLAQLQRWKLLPHDLQVPVKGLTADEILSKIREANNSVEAVEIRSTDLDILKEYMKGKVQGRLHLADDSGPSSIKVDYAVLPSGNIVIPWQDENIADIMLSPETYLKPVGAKRIYFSDVDDLFFGEHKAFMVCTPAKDIDNG